MSQWEYLIKPLELKTPISEVPLEEHIEMSVEEIELLQDKQRTGEYPSFDSQLQSHLNLLGSDGWEVFHVEVHKTFTNEYKIWAKRRAEG